MNQDTTSLGKIVGLVKPTKTDALLKLTSLSYHHISSKAGASAAKLIAELRLGICVALSTAVHTIAAQHALSMLQVVDEEPLLARWNGEINQDITAVPLKWASRSLKQLKHSLLEEVFHVRRFESVILQPINGLLYEQKQICVRTIG